MKFETEVVYRKLSNKRGSSADRLSGSHALRESSADRLSGSHALRESSAHRLSGSHALRGSSADRLSGSHALRGSLNVYLPSNAFIRPTNEQLNFFKILKFTFRFTINPPTCFGLTKPSSGSLQSVLR